MEGKSAACEKARWGRGGMELREGGAELRGDSKAIQHF